ncbi:beta-N-acetylhexosaminidase [Paraliomyxa miuraensis]|uniref:beta-N-acetylhexosaminidase n=1 Tax=Paraliomyxa miuraensis TaxID=376150 RepID=UPI0022582D43|nr:beta-N-acetylhexosaminidase [Paraliomyxa miuraensis]MCX4247361.1 beta-N-acetylhexosaminidase [Paraliomyxa miuraensis]
MTSWWQPGQLLFVGFAGTEVPRDLAALLGQGRVGGVVLFSRNIESPTQLRALVDALHEAAPPELPPLLAIDQEGGRVQRLRDPWTEWPPMRRLGDRDEPRATRALAQALARELSELRIHLDFAPVVDVDTNPQNPVIGDRSFGREPARVIRHACAVIEGLQAGGVAACAKHFPGHGDTDLDSHLQLPRVRHDLHRLREVELAPFAAAVEAGVASIMTAHVVFEALDPRRPATLSPDVMALLREELRYDGVVFSDDLEMKAVADHFRPEQLVHGSLEAGVDAILVCSDAGLRDEVLQRLERAPDNLVERAVARVVALKQRYASGARPAASAAAVAGADAPSPSGLVITLDRAVAEGIGPAPAASDPAGPPYPEHRELAERLARDR